MRKPMNMDRLFANQPVAYHNSVGNPVKKMFYSADRYLFDSHLSKDWQQYDTEQDAWYFGCWLNLKERKILTYAEGDLTLSEAPDDAQLKKELDAMAEYYGEPPAAFVVISADENKVTFIYDQRPNLS